MKHIEDQIQIEIFKWLRLQHKDILAFHVPNGGKRNLLEAARLKRMGVLAGVADVLILEPRGKHPLLALELKSQGGKQTPLQAVFEANCIRRNIKYKIAKSFYQAKEIIDEYLNL
jgi:VRR-NUC domain